MTRPHRSDLLGAGLVLVAFVPFLFTLDTFFVSDDLQMAVFGKTMSPGDMDWLPSSRWSWHRPVPAFSWIVNYRISGLHVAAWHATNVCIHAASTALGFFLALQWSRSRAIAWGTAILFACSPATPGTVTWISARPDLMVTFFCLATLAWAYAPALKARPMLQVVAVTAAVVLAVSSKESAFGLLPVAALLAIVPRALPGGAPWRLEMRLLAVIAMVLLGFLAVRFLMYGSTLGGYGVPLSLRRLITAPLLVIPSLLAPLRLLFHASAYSLAAQLAGVLVAGFCLLRAPLWTLAALAAVFPAAHLISASMVPWEYDRFYYLSSFFAAGAMATTLVWLHERRRWLGVVGVCILAVSTVGYQWLRVRDVRAASAITASTHETLQRAAKAGLPAGAVIWCARLPDSVGEAYCYRNGCEAQAQLLWPNGDVTGVRSPERPAAAVLYEVSADGRALDTVRRDDRPTP